MNNLKKAKLASQGYVGSIDDAYKKYLQDSTQSSSMSIDDLEKLFLKTLGYVGAVQDMYRSYFLDMGLSGSITDMLYRVWNTTGFDDVAFYAPLKTSLALVRGVGAPSFTRATTATFTDFEGVVRTAKIGEARFQGGRRVENLLSATEDFTSWTKTNTTVADGKLIETTANSLHMLDTFFTPISGATYVWSVEVKAAERSFAVLQITCGGLNTYQTFNLATGQLGTTASLAGGEARITAASDGYWKISLKNTTISAVGNPIRLWVSNADSIGSYVGDTTKGIYFRKPQLENVTGQSVQTPGEYVSVGVLSAPYHGSNVDGVKYFDTKLDGTAVSYSAYLSEGARTNLLTYSEQFDNALWPKSNATIGANTSVAPDGTQTADKLQETAVTSVFDCSQTVSKAASATTYVLTIYGKAAERKWLKLYLTNGGTTAGANALFDTQAGVTAATGTFGTGFTFLSSSISNAGNGWFRCSIVCTSDADVTVKAYCRLFNESGQESYAGTVGQGLYIWGSQLEAATFASTYIPTTTAAVTRNADVLTYQSAGNVIGTTGSIYAEATVIGSGTDAVVGIQDSAGSNSAAIYSTGVSITFGVDSGGVNQAGLSSGTATAGTRFKVAGTWVLNRFTSCKDGGSVVSDTSGTTPDLSASTIGVGILRTGFQAQPFGTIRNVKIYQRALTDTNLQAMTT